MFDKNSDMAEAAIQDNGDHNNMECNAGEYSDVSQYSEIPAQVEKHLEFLKLNKFGHLLLGSSSLTGRYWGGSVWYYEDPLVAPSVEESTVAVEFTNGVTQAAFITNTNAVVAQDNGVLDFLTLDIDGNPAMIHKTCTIEDHTSSILCLDVTCDSKYFVTGSFDMSIRVWDSECTVCRHTYSPAHSQEVNNVCTHPSQPNLFLSSSLDGNVLLWDIRCSRPASGVYRDLQELPTCVCWIGNGSDSYMIGSTFGNLHLRHIKNVAYNLQSTAVIQRSLYRLNTNPHNRELLSVCGNDSKVKVFKVMPDHTISLKYEDDQHSDFARDTTWLKETQLLSCGWDKKVIKHSFL